MSRKLTLAGALVAVGSLTILLDRATPAASPAPVGVFDVIDFDNPTDYPAGTILDEVYTAGGFGPIGVYGTNPSIGGQNTAVVFDSSMRTGGDPDLGTPNQAFFGGPGMGSGGGPGPYQNDKERLNILIVAEDLVDVQVPFGLVDDPDDADLVGASIEFDFTQADGATVTSYGMTIIDVEADEPSATVKFFNKSAMQIGPTIMLPQTGDNGVKEVLWEPVPGVARMEVDLNGSGAIDELLVEPEKQEECNPCIEISMDCVAPATPEGKFLISGEIKNCGNVVLDRINIYNNKAGYVLVHFAPLPPNAVKEFSGMYPADVGAGQCSKSITSVVAHAPDACKLPPLEKAAMATCCIPAVPKDEGCTPGYWKNHEEHWDEPTDGVAFNAEFTTSTKFHTFFNVTPMQSNTPLGTTMLDAISAEITGGGPEHAIGWHGIAALLNIAAGLDYQLPPGVNSAAELKTKLETAWQTGNFEPLKSYLSSANEAGCPLNNQPPLPPVED